MTYIEIAIDSFFMFHGRGLIILPLQPSITLIFASFVKMNITSFAELSELFVSEFFGLLARLWELLSSFQRIEMTGELEQDTSFRKNATDKELMSITASWKEPINFRNLYINEEALITAQIQTYNNNRW